MPCADFPFVFSAVVHGSLHMSSGSAGSLVSVPSAVNHLSAEKNMFIRFGSDCSRALWSAKLPHHSFSLAVRLYNGIAGRQENVVIN